MSASSLSSVRAASALHRLLRRRPLASACAVGTSGTIAVAFLIERRAEYAERNYHHYYRREMHVAPAAATENRRHDDYVVLPRDYDWNALNLYWTHRPVTAATRLFQIACEMTPFAGSLFWDFVLAPAVGFCGTARDDDPAAAEAELQAKHACRLKDILTELGPAFVKAGQQLSIRPDLAPPVVLKELQKLCDSVRPVPDDVAMQVIRDELGNDNLNELFDDMELVASASLGQVYRAKLRDSGDVVAVKVQRPDMRRNFSLDLYLLQRIGVMVDVFTSLFTNQPPFHKALYETFARGSYMELDYENEAKNQIRFRTELAERDCPVVVPNVYRKFSSERVLTTQWIDGIKLADSPKEQIRKLIPVGVELFLTQLLDMGAFHSGKLASCAGRSELLKYRGIFAALSFRKSRDCTSRILFPSLFSFRSSPGKFARHQEWSAVLDRLWSVRRG